MANTSYTIRPSADGNQYSNYPSGDFTKQANIPTNFIALVSVQNVTLNWTDTNSGQAQTEVYRSIDNGQTYALVATRAQGVNSFSDLGLPNGNYLYRIRAFILDSYSAYTLAQYAVVAAPSSWQLATGHYETAKMPLEVIAPRAGLTTANPYYKAYPALKYRFPVSVLGGAWPYRYEIVSGPDGLTIGQYYGAINYGIIEWSNPVTSGSPHSITVRVTDQQGAVVTVTWPLTVTTSGFLFVDAVNGNNSNSGTLASPKQNINGWYVSYSDASYQGYFVYYRNGTYRIDAANDPTGQSNSQWTRCFGDRKPNVHLNYPGESPVWDATNYSFCFSNTFAPTVIGIGAANVGAGGSLGWVWWDSAPDALMFENSIGASAAPGVGGSNPSIFMSRRNSVSNYQSIIGNTFDGVDGHDLFLAYDTNKTVCENNTVINYTGGGSGGQSHGFFFKESNTNASVRNNRGMTGNSAELVHVTMTNTFNTVEVCWNNYKSTLPGIWVGPNTDTALNNFQEYRNTWQVPYNLMSIVYAGTMTGTWNSQRNVYIHDGATATGILVDASSGGGANFAGTLTQNNLEGTVSERDINSSTGALTNDDRLTYLGVQGWEVA